MSETTETPEQDIKGQPLSYENQWHYDQYKVAGFPIYELEEIMWNGQIYPVTSQVIDVPYSDHGSPQTARSRHFFIEVEVLGVTIPIDLNKIIRKNPDILATKWTYH